MSRLQSKVAELELHTMSFSEEDAVFVTDSVQVEYLQAGTNSSFLRSWLYPLSLQAYGAALRTDHAKIKSYFEFVDFADCKDWYHQGALHFAKEWLQELDLEFRFEGINLAKLDAPNQFLIFAHARYLGPTAERLIQDSPDIKRFYVVAAENRLPLDFYFDSDVSSAILQFVCERLGRVVRVIAMKHRPRHIFPEFQQRPAVDLGDPSPPVDASIRKAFRSSRRRVGFVPATVPNSQQILASFRELGCPTVVFPSIWPPKLQPSIGNGRVPEFAFQLAAADGEWSPKVSVQLADLRDRFYERRNRSTLPEYMIRNPHLDFQYDYIFTRRWLAYANMIRRAVQFAADVPLDLFVCSDHFSAEGAILASVYRQHRTRILVTLHSGWPCDRNWTFYDPSDRGMVPSKTCREKVRQLSNMSEVFVTGPDSSRSFQSLARLARLPDLQAEIRRVAAGRRIVLLVTNALELDCVPFTDLRSHFQTVAQLAVVPEHLKDQVLVAVRTKPGVHGEDSELYRKLCGFPSEGLNLFDNLSFSDSIRLADLIVGINVPTTGYFEILESGTPLLHALTADVLSLQPDLPTDVVERISDPESIWRAIEGVLFDKGKLEELVDVQKRFVDFDFQSETSDERDPVYAIIQNLLDGQKFAGWSAWFKEVRNIAGRWLGRKEEDLGHQERGCLLQGKRWGAGFVDDVLIGPRSIVAIEGWAADLGAHRPAKAVHVYRGDSWMAMASPDRFRPDVAAAYDDKRLEFSGFSIQVRFSEEIQTEDLSVYSELHDGTFYQLPSNFLGRIFVT